MAEQQPWHHLFGLSWMDFFHGTTVKVEPETDLSHKQQLLDLVILRPDGAAPPRRLPDGFENLGLYNLVTFKSYQETLDGWALNELVAHYVNYRKQVSPSMQQLLPESDFRRFAVCVRSPENLKRQGVLQRLGEGLYEARHFGDTIRVIVVHEFPQQEHNAMLLLFSAREDLLAYASQHHQPHSHETSTLLLQLVARYSQEGIPMPETLKEFAQRTIDELLNTLPPEELRKRLSPEERLEGLSPEERVKGLTPEALEELARRMRANGGQPDQG